MFLGVFIGFHILVNAINYVGCNSVDDLSQNCWEYKQTTIVRDYPNPSDY